MTMRCPRNSTKCDLALKFPVGRLSCLTNFVTVHNVTIGWQTLRALWGVFPIEFSCGTYLRLSRRETGPPSTRTLVTACIRTMNTGPHQDAPSVVNYIPAMIAYWNSKSMGLQRMVA